MGIVTEALVQLIAKQVDDKGLVVWYDPEQAYGAVAAELQLPNTTVARSPCIPAPTITGLPGRGPRSLVSVLKRRLNSHAFSTLPSAVFTVYVSPQ